MRRAWTEAEVTRADALRRQGLSLERIGAALGRDPWGRLARVLRLSGEGLAPAAVLERLGLGGRRCPERHEDRLARYQARAALRLPLFAHDEGEFPC